MQTQISLIFYAVIACLYLSCDNTDAEVLEQPRVRALLATNFNGLEDFQEVVTLEYTEKSTDSAKGTVKISYKNNGELIVGELSDGVTEGDISKAFRGNIWDKLSLSAKTPYALWNRKKLGNVYMLARHMIGDLGEDDVAFYDVALASMRNISPENGAFDNFRDSLEKGYINTFNHVTAQALITLLYGEDLANYIAEVHERNTMPNLVSGLFSETQLKDTLDFPVDNYVDIINNEIGQELGKYLKSKHNISDETKWDAAFTCQVLNDIQDYYASCFQLKVNQFSIQDDMIINFARKMEGIRTGKFQI